MRVLLATLTLASGFLTSTVENNQGHVHVAQMARDVTDAVRKQRAQRRARQHQKNQTSEEAGR